MFNSMRIYLKKKIDASLVETKIQARLHKFLLHNPDIDHYLCDDNKRRNLANLILGFMVGLMICLILFLLLITYWQDVGYLRYPIF